MATNRDYRIKITCPQMGNVSFIVRESGKVSYYSADETPLALSNLVHAQAAELRFALKDATFVGEAIKAVREALNKAFPRADKDKLPQVQSI